MKNFIKYIINAILTDKEVLDIIITFLEKLSKSTTNDIDDTLIEILKKEVSKMQDVSIKMYDK